MGSAICRLAETSGDWEVAGRVDLDLPLEKVISAGEIIIDFTQPEATQNHLRLAQKNKKPMVIGTTGLNEAEQQSVREAARHIPIVWSPNMSVGVNLLFKLTELAAQILDKNYTIKITETHHVHKKDSPSGTAKTLGAIVEKIRGQKPPIDSIREGEVVGEHAVVFGSGREHLALMHRALDRSVFAEGALKAAQWIVGKKPGLYTMADVLGFI
ncbi:MAG: 4-hydroxy-tetrahydrodipicolinate reductase [Deltaproteobacteria bacterium]|nr:4-hydroxy-tetrahydrodipicolinate reductase [Deltaproteobacteria bacterium]